MEGCHPPYGSISKGGQVFFLLISFIFTDQDRMCHPEFHFRITSEVCSGFHLFFIFLTCSSNNGFLLALYLFQGDFPSQENQSEI